MKTFCKKLNRETLDESIKQLSLQKSIAIPCLDEKERLSFIAAADSLNYRPAKSITGSPNAPVYQDFELCYDLPPTNIFWNLACFLESYVRRTLKNLDIVRHSNFRFNDLIVQRYLPGCAGITPHRDHLKYEILVAIIVLSGDGNFIVCDDRAGAGSEIIKALPGDLLLMLAPGLPSSEIRPFHYVSGISKTRRTVGLRYDSHA
ncbi:MAG: hypothetical protein CL398_08130 [Acidiferrobacteraceae bacterium]|nr:hypothetical protein [Acidiferrobacteraceae bacterium]